MWNHGLFPLLEESVQKAKQNPMNCLLNFNARMMQMKLVFLQERCLGHIPSFKTPHCLCNPLIETSQLYRPFFFFASDDYFLLCKLKRSARSFKDRLFSRDAITLMEFRRTTDNNEETTVNFMIASFSILTVLIFDVYSICAHPRFWIKSLMSDIRHDVVRILIFLWTSTSWN